MARQAQITLADVARVAGVSTSTASRVLNGSDKTVSEELTVRITAVAEALGYVSNRAAQALRGRRTGVFMLVSDPRTEPIMAQASGMEAAARELGVLASVVVVGADPAARRDYIRMLLNLRPRAIIVNYSWNLDTLSAPLLKAFADDGGRVVVVGDEDQGFPAVRYHDEESGRLMAAHFASLGRSRLAVVTGSHPAFNVRIRALVKVWQSRGLPGPVATVMAPTLTRDGGHQAACDIADMDPMPDMVYVPNDVLATGVLGGFRARGIRVPQDIAVGSNDDIPIAQDLTPSLTTVHLDFEQAGRAALAMAVCENFPEDIHMPGRLMVRGSTVSEEAMPC